MLSIKNKRESIINNIRLNVLGDIEKEIAQKEAEVKEETQKLETQQIIEQYPNRGKFSKRKFVNVQEEIAATSDSIIDNTQNDKKTKGSGRYISGFINIIIEKRFSK